MVHESITILAYLERKHREPALFGDTPEETALIWQLVFEVMNYACDAIISGVALPHMRALHMGFDELGKTYPCIVASLAGLRPCQRMTMPIHHIGEELVGEPMAQ